MDLTALNSELTNDPLGMGYQEHIDSGNINALRDLINREIIPWEEGAAYEMGDLRTYSGTLYRCRQDHTNNDPNHTPDTTPALWLQLSSIDSPPAVRRSSIAMEEVLDAIEWTSEYASLSNVEREFVQVLTMRNTLDGTRQGNLDTLETIFGTDSTTWQSISAILDRAGSRAEAVVGEQVTNADIIQALNNN